MAKIVEELVIIKLSKIVKDGAVEETTCVSEELLQTIETVAQELVGDAVVVEVETGGVE
jgi:hypothetical protein